VTFASHAENQLLALLIAGHQLATPTEHECHVKMHAAMFAYMVIAPHEPSE